MITFLLQCHSSTGEAGPVLPRGGESPKRKLCWLKTILDKKLFKGLDVLLIGKKVACHGLGMKRALFLLLHLCKS